LNPRPLESVFRKNQKKIKKEKSIDLLVRYAYTVALLKIKDSRVETHFHTHKNVTRRKKIFCIYL